MENNIIVLGHHNPDVDSIVSGIVLSKYLIYKGYKTSYVIPDKNIDKETQNALKALKIDFKAYQGDILKESSLILVDHHETNYFNNILAVIDHHPTLKEFNYPVYINKKASSTAKLVYDIIAESDKDFLSGDIIEWIVAATMIDTCSFKSSKTNKPDISWSIEICKKYDLDYDNLIRLGYCLTDLTDANESCVNGFKEFVYNEKVVKTSYIQCDSFDYPKIQENIDILSEKVNQENIHMWVFLVIDIENEGTIEYRIYKDRVHEIYHDAIVSRGSTIMPIIEKLLMD